jgi:hypothetical protein
MARFALCLILFLFSIKGGVAQSSAELDSLGRLYYINADWEAVRQNSKAAISVGYTTYAFVIRLAVAELEQGRWVQAEKHLRQAIVLNSIEKTPKVLLAGLLRKMGRTEEAAYYQRVPFYMYTGVDGGLKVSNTDSLGILNYQGAHLKHQIHPSASLTHAFTRLSQNLYWGDFTQLQYYLAYRQAFRSGWLLALGTHFLRFSGNVLFDSSQFNNGGEVVAMELSKQFGIIGLAPQYSFSTLYGRIQQQLGFKLSLFPARFGAVRYDLNPMFNRDSTATASALSQVLHWFPSSRLHFALNHYVGNGYNFQEQLGYLVNNGINLTRNRWGGYVEYGFHQKWRLYLLYQNERGTERFFNFNYRYNCIYLGLKFQS